MSLMQELDRLVDELGAEAAAVRHPADASSDGFVVAASPRTLAPVGASWPLAEVPMGRAMVLRDPASFARVLPTAMRLALPSTPCELVAAPLGENLTLVVVGCGPDDIGAEVLDALAGETGTRLARVATDFARQQTLETVAARATALLGALEQAVVIVDHDRATAELNAAGAALLGAPAGESPLSAVAQAMRAFQETVINTEAVDQVGAALAADPGASVAGVIWEREQEPAFVRVSSTPIAGDAPGGRVWVFDDVSVELRAAREAEAALERARESEARYRLLAENASDVVISGDNDGTLTWMSPSVTALMGWQPDEVVGQKFLDFVHPDDRPGIRVHQQRLADGQRTWFEVRLRMKDGDWRWVAVSVQPLFDDHGNVVGRAGSWRDIQPEHEQWQLFGRAIDSLPDVAVLIVDHDLRFRIVRGGIFAAPGIGSSDWEGHLIDEVVPEPDRGRWKPMYAAALAGRETVVEHEAESGRTYRTAVSPLRRPDGTTYGAVALAVDITQRAQLEQMKDRMIATVSHELRTPVTSLSLLLEELAADPTLPHTTRRLVGVGERSTARLRRLVEDLLLLAEADQTGVRLVFEPVQPEHIVADAVAELHPMADDKGVTLGAEVQPVPGVRADAMRLSQVVVNLIGNAIKFTPSGGTVTASVRPDDGHWLLQVTDSGIGIPADEVEHLFDPFFRASTATDAVISGTGLGLAVVHHLVTGHGGELAVSSDVGRGTTISVRFPFDPPAAEA